jgi:hypothetical protein
MSQSYIEDHWIVENVLKVMSEVYNSIPILCIVNDFKMLEAKPGFIINCVNVLWLIKKIYLLQAFDCQSAVFDGRPSKTADFDG